MTDLYIASCCETGGIYHFLLDQTGLHEADVCPLDRPMYLALRDDKLYALLRDPEKTGQSGLVCATLDVTGKPTLQSEITATQGTVGCHLAVTDRGVFVANYVSGSVFRTPNRLVTHSGKGFRPDRQEKAHTHCTVLTPDGQYICVADLGLDKIFVYDLELQPVPQFRCRTVPARGISPLRRTAALCTAYVSFPQRSAVFRIRTVI